jgi:hypothetical protein
MATTPYRFTLRSTELRDYSEKHACRVLGTIQGEKLLVEIDPPFPGYVYGLAHDLSRVVLAPRHQGSRLAPNISEWPCRVHICLPKEGGDFKNGPFRILDWGIIEQQELAE